MPSMLLSRNSRKKMLASARCLLTRSLLQTTRWLLKRLPRLLLPLSPYSSRIASRKYLVNVKEVAEYAKANGKKIVVTGYADSKTGSSSYNQQLSEKRANAVANELVKMGVNRDDIIVEAKG